LKHELDSHSSWFDSIYPSDYTSKYFYAPNKIVYKAVFEAAKEAVAAAQKVAKEAADIVLLEDNFGDILSAVEEGRNMRQGIRRTITYLFSSNIGEILLITIALLLRDPLPLIAAQLIWMNVVTDTFFDISLALEPKDPSLMQRHAIIKQKLIDRVVASRLAFIAPVIAIGAFLLFREYLEDITKARTMALTSLVIFQWLNAWNCRSEEKSIFQINPFSNRFLLATFLGVAILHSFALYNPFLNTILRIGPLTLKEIGVIAFFALSVIIVEEVRKFIVRRMRAKNEPLLSTPYTPSSVGGV